MKINIVIVGAYDYDKNIDIDILNNYKKWNNPLQACHQDLELLITRLQHENYKKIRVICLDPMYAFSRSDSCSNIHYINRPFLLGDTDYLSKSGHNIIVEFSNLLDEYFVTKDNMQAECLQLYNDFKISIIACGCGWDKRLPIELIMTLIMEDVYTPTDVNDKYSYMYAKEFNDLYAGTEYQPFCQGLYQVLGSLMWRGCRENGYKYEEVLHSLFKNIDISAYPPDICKDLQRFIDGELHWNNLARPTRLFLNELTYGKHIIIT